MGRSTTKFDVVKGEEPLRITLGPGRQAVVNGNSASVAAAPANALARDLDAAIDALRTRGATVHSLANGKRFAVHFREMCLSDKDVCQLSKLGEARSLSVTVRGRKFTDADAQRLSRLPLKRIGLFGTQISQKGIDTLHDALPDVAIARSNGPLLGASLTDDVEITRLVRGAAAETAGLRVGDRICTFGGRKTENSHDLLKLVSRSRPGDIIELEFLRDSQLRKVKIQIGRLVNIGPDATHAPDAENKK
jgi:predicted metalloprotease with PDZ domain